jgi:hypothetical protein
MGGNFVLFIGKVRFYIEPGRQNIRRTLPLYFTIELFCSPRLLVPQNFGALCAGTPRTTLMPALLVPVFNYVPSHEHASGVNYTQAITLRLDKIDWLALPLYALVKSL